MKRITAITALLLLCFSQIGYFLIYSIRIQQVKNTVQQELIATLPENAFTKICLEANTDAIKWEEEGREFSMKGEMYDVARIKMENGRTTLYCLSDKKEDQVLDDYSKSVRAGNENNSSSKHQLNLKLQFPDLISTKTENKSGHIIQNAPTAYFDMVPDIVSSVKEIITPPPDLSIKI